MSTFTYIIVEHDGGWAYKLGDSFSETYQSHDDALAAAQIAAAVQRIAGKTTPISWEDDQGKWHYEIAKGDDRPNTEVQD
jgi:hypothetical protein